MTDDEIGTALIGCALRVHSALGPGLLESVYQTCLVYELEKAAIPSKREVAIPIAYDGVKLKDGLKIDILIADRVIAELKAVDKLLPIHAAQLITYLKLTGLKIGYLLNFNVLRVLRGSV